MNYIELINNFWRIHQERCFSPIEVALYFYLLNVSNGLGWKNPFNHSNTFITGYLGISEKTLIGARKNLELAGVIEFTSGNGRRYSSSYLIKGCNNSTLPGSLSGTLSGSLMGSNTPANNKLNKTKRNNSKSGETNVSQQVHVLAGSFDSKEDLIDSEANYKREEEKPVEGKLDKNNFPDKDSINNKAPRFIKPTLLEITAYCQERRNHVNPEQWFDYYTANGWRVGKNPMKDWKAAVRTWENNGIDNRKAPIEPVAYGFGSEQNHGEKKGRTSTL